MITTILQAILLGIVQGLTEFIPISSSVHLIIVPWLFGWTNPALSSLTFDMALHTGTLIAVLAYFASDWVRLIRAWFMSVKELKINGNPDRQMAWFIAIGTLPGAIVGSLAESKIEKLFHQPGVSIKADAIIIMAIIISVLGILLFLADLRPNHNRDLNHLTFKDVLIIGFTQALAIFPGVSRSGSTITAGLWLGLKRDAAAKFSFLLSAPILAGASLLSLYEIYKGLHRGLIARSDLILFPIGLIVATISGFFCIRFLMQFLQKRPLAIFAYYRLGLALLIIVVALLR